MKQEFDIEDTWVSYELHPETPEQGRLMSEFFPNFQREQMSANLNAAGAPYGLQFNHSDIMPNTRKALHASEYAREQGKHHEIHGKLFEAYFRDGKNIGELPVLLDIGEEIGLDRDALESAIVTEKYAPILEQAHRDGQMYGVTGTPTIIINNKYKLVGAQPLEVVRGALNKIQNGDI